MDTLHVLNPWYHPGPADFLHRSAMHGHTPELFNNAAILLNAAPGAVPWIGATGVIGLLLVAILHVVRTGRFAAALRHYLWRIVVSRSGGLTVTGRWRHAGGCILVANHSSHADTAVLLAALPPSAKPVFVAAADYWFDVPVRRFVLQPRGRITRTAIGLRLQLCGTALDDQARTRCGPHCRDLPGGNSQHKRQYRRVSFWCNSFSEGLRSTCRSCCTTGHR